MDEETITRETEVKKTGYPTPIVVASAIVFFIALAYAFIGVTQLLIGTIPFVAIFPFQESYTNPELQAMALEGVHKMLLAAIAIFADFMILAIPAIVMGFFKNED